MKLRMCIIWLLMIFPALLRGELTAGLTKWPHSIRKTAFATDNSLIGMELFAVVGTGGCAQSLYYGPQSITTSGSADGNYRTFLSTNMPYTEVPSDQWLQIVTVDGIEELFRVYWTFDTSKTYTQRIVDAVTTGEVVSYTIVDAETGAEMRYSGTWRYSSASAITARTFAKSTTTCCLSQNGGLWGGGSNTIDGSHRRRGNNNNANFWGVGNYRDTDSSDCHVVWAESQGYVFEDEEPIAYMYHSLADTPTTVPTPAPTARPTFTPIPTLPAPTPVPSTARPTASPSRSAQPTITGQQLFASIGGDSCASTLYYGPQAVRTTGSADGQHASFVSTSTTYRTIAHTEWLQIVTSDGTTELFRIYWTFDTARTLADHFAAAASDNGAAVSYRLVTVTGETTEDSFTWRFTSAAFDASDVFNARTTACCFSSTAAWGVGKAQDKQGAVVPAWGQGNPGGRDTQSCGTVYMNGVAASIRSQGRSYFYYAPDSLSSGGSAKYGLVQFTSTVIIQGISKAQYEADSSTYDNLFRKAVAWSLPGVSEHDISGIAVSTSSSSDITSATAAAEAEPLTALTAVSSIAVTCTVTVTNSAYSYAQLAYALQVAVAGTVFNTQLHNYAAYLQLTTATSANAISVTTTQTTAASSTSNDRKGSVSKVTTTAIVLGVVFAVVFVGAFYYYERCGLFKRIGQVDVGSTHSVDEEAAGRVRSRRGLGTTAEDTDEDADGTTARSAQRVSPHARQRNNRLHTLAEVGYVSNDADRSDEDGVEMGTIGSAVHARAVPALATVEHVPYTIVRASRSQPRGASEVPFAVSSTQNRNSNSSTSDIVQITPRSVQIARATLRRSTSSQNMTTPVVHAQVVQPSAEIVSVSAAAVMALPMEGSTIQGVAVAQLAPARR